MICVFIGEGEEISRCQDAMADLYIYFTSWVVDPFSAFYIYSVDMIESLIKILTAMSPMLLLKVGLFFLLLNSSPPLLSILSLFLTNQTPLLPKGLP